MDYLEVSNDIFKWLSDLQIDIGEQRSIIKDDKLELEYKHPIYGEIKSQIDCPVDQYFSFNGIGFEVNNNKTSEVFIKSYDDGGIFDPIDQCVIGEQYATTHFALLGSTLFLYLQDKSILQKIVKAMNFHFMTSKDEYLFRDGYYHHDFNNLAAIDTYQLISHHLPNEMKLNWEIELKQWKESLRNPLANWVGMRAYNALVRYQLFDSFRDRINFLWRIRNLDWSRLADGLYEDEINQSRSIQYHVYTIALLFKILMVKYNKKLAHKFLEGVDYFIRFIDDDGVFNYMGRGQEQIFGYASAIYVLEAAKLLNPTEFSKYNYLLESICHYLFSFQKDGYFPIVLNKSEIKQKMGWYDYNHLTVYNAFLGVWLASTHHLKNSFKLQVNQGKAYVHNFSETYYSKPSKTCFIKKDEYSVVFCKNTHKYSTEPGITPLHIRFNKIGWIFSCPGNPNIDRTNIDLNNKIDNTNYFAPVYLDSQKKWHAPVLKRNSRFKVHPDCLELTFNYDAFLLVRTVKFNNEAILFQDIFKFKKEHQVLELRYFNIPVVIDKFKFNYENSTLFLESEQGRIKIDVFDTNFSNNIFHTEEKIETPHGIAQILCLKELNFNGEEYNDKYCHFTIQQR